MTRSSKTARYGLPNRALLEAIGKVALRQGQLDNAMKVLIMDLADVSWDEAFDATTMQPPRELRDRIRKLAKIAFGEGAALVRLQSLMQRAQVATDKRNEFIHSFWGLRDEGPVIRDREHEYHPAPSVDKLNALADDLDDVRRDISEARQEGFIAKALEKRQRANPKE